MTDSIKDKVQNEAVQAIETFNGRGIIVIATGGGKSRVPIMYAKKKDYKKIALIVPTEELRDDSWLKEFKEIGEEVLYAHVDRYCYASASKVLDKDYDLVILDECHHITPLSSSFFQNNRIKDIVGLTATLPTEVEKKDILKAQRINPIYTISLDEAKEMGLIAPFKIYIHYVKLDSVTLNVQGGSKKKPFLTTELKQYQYLSKTIRDMRYYNMGDEILVKKNLTPAEQKKVEMLTFKRLRLIYGLKSKTEAARKLIESLPDDEKTLIFCGSIDQAEELCDYTYHSKTSDSDLTRFKNGDINKMSCVLALNEGVNIPNLDNGIVVQLNSKERDLVQRIGRIVRKRPGHEATIHIICCRDTQDEVWLNEALKNIDPSNIIYCN